MRRTPEEMAAAFRAACRGELEALKPGNVHVLADGHRMTVQDFVRSADAAAPALCAAGRSVGARVLAAVEATSTAVGQNTNLGIVLLAAPIVQAAETGRGIGEILAGLTREDAVLTYRAIRLASPGGLGRSERHDVAEEPEVTLLEAMRTAADRDRIAYQYAHGFQDVLGLGVPTLRQRRRAGWAEPWAVTSTFMAFLASFPDSHVVRKHGAAAAEAVREQAAALRGRLVVARDPATMAPALLAFDAALKAQGVNPGTSADLTVASLLAAELLDPSEGERIS